MSKSTPPADTPAIERQSTDPDAEGFVPAWLAERLDAPKVPTNYGAEAQARAFTQE